MWKPGRGAYYPVDKDGVVTVMHVMERGRDDVTAFVGILCGRTSRNHYVEKNVLAWRNPEDISFRLYLWSRGQHEYVGRVNASDVKMLG